MMAGGIELAWRLSFATPWLETGRAGPESTVSVLNADNALVARDARTSSGRLESVVVMV
jgi:hypothetical protein